MIIEQLNTPTQREVTYHLLVFAWSPDDAVTRSILGLKPETPLQFFEMKHLQTRIPTGYMLPSGTDRLPGTGYWSTALGAVKQIAYRVLLNAAQAVPREPTAYDRRSFEKVVGFLTTMSDNSLLDRNNFTQHWGFADRLVGFKITRLDLSTPLQVIEPVMAKLEASAELEPLTKKLEEWDQSYDQRLLTRLWIPAARSYATQTAWLPTLEQRGLAADISYCHQDGPFNAKAMADWDWANQNPGPNRKVLGGIGFIPWLVRCGYADQDKRGVLRPRCKVGKARQAQLGPDPTAPGNEGIPVKVAEDMAKELAAPKPAP